MHETEERMLSALADTEAFSELFERRNRSRYGNGASHVVYCMRCSEALPDF